MTEIQKEQIRKIVYTFTKLANVNDERICNDLISRLSAMSEEDVIDYLVVALSDLVEKGQVKSEDIFSNANLITSLSENHQLVIEAFDKFNQLIGTDFDSYYTGGLMGYLATNHPLERYHGDLDLFINEEQLQSLYELVKQNDEFEFISNMDHKEENGHEFKIQYKGTSMSIGLFLFERIP